MLLPAAEGPGALPGGLWLLLCLSGAIGIGLGDSAYFAALLRLGERNTILVAETVAPILTLVLAGFWLQEWPGGSSLLGMAVVLASLVLALGGESKAPAGAWPGRGLAWALLAALCQAAGAVLTRQAFVSYPLDALLSSLLRLVSGIAFLGVLFPLRRQRPWPSATPGRRAIACLVAGSLLGTLGGIVFQQLAFRHAPAALAQTTLATSVILVMVFQRLAGNAVSGRAWLGGLLAVVGVFLLLA